MPSRRTLILGSLAIALLFWLLLPSFLQYFAQRELLKLHSSGIKLKVNGLIGKRVGLGAESVEGWLAIPVRNKTPVSNVPVNYRFEDIEVLARIPLLTPWKPGVTVNARAYGGRIDAVASDLTAAPTLSAEISQVNLSLHPQLRALGFDSGLLSALVKNHPLSLNQVSTSEYSVRVEQVELALPSSISDLIKISALSQGKLSCNLSLAPSGSFALPTCEFSSSAAKLTLSGRGTLIKMQSIDQFSGTLNVNLLGEDGAKLSQWMPILTNQRVRSVDSNFSCSLQIGACGSLSSFDFRIGPRCGRAVCGS